MQYPKQSSKQYGLPFRYVLSAALLGTVLSPVAASADPLPLSPNDAVAGQRWINPAIRAVDTSAEITLELLSAPTAIAVDEPLDIQIRVHNNSTEPMSNYNIAPQYAPAIFDVAQGRTIITAGYEAYPNYLPEVPLLDDANHAPSIAPGETWEQTLQIASPFHEPGVYPMLLGLRGPEGIVHTQRFLLSVGQIQPEEDAEDHTLTVVYPITADVDIVQGETGDAPEPAPLILRSEHLGEQLAGGRLQTLLDAITNSPEVHSATCLAVDPQLLDTVQRMARGYMVAESRPSSVSQKRRLRDSWSKQESNELQTQGQYADAAQAWLDQLTDLDICTVALPWANTDLDAVKATGNRWLLREALQRGTSVLEQAGLEPISNIVIPGKGYIQSPLAADLGWADVAGAQAGTNGLTTNITAAWESAKAHAAQNTAPDRADSDEASSSLESLDATDSALEPDTVPQPSVPVQVLVADNTVWDAPSADRFAALAPNVQAVRYQGSLAATLAEAIETPMTVGYGNYAARFDYTLDAQAARETTAHAAIRQTLASEQHSLLMLPADANNPEKWLSTLASLMDDNVVKPLALPDYVRPNQEQSEQLQRGEAPEVLGIGSPYDDPTVISDTEVLHARQQADYTDDLTRFMVNDPAIALSPYEFTVPLRHEVLRALSRNGRQSIGSFDAKVRQAHDTLNANREVLKELRDSVSLLPPGNVYTRISESSPLLIAAQNGLPLPVDTRIRYSGPEGANIAIPERIIVPAKGSMTLQMTAKLPQENRTDLQLWLATPDGAAISDPVNIAIQTRSGFSGSAGVALLAVSTLLLALGVRFVLRRKKARDEE